MSYTFADLKTNKEIQNIVLNRIPYGKQCICEPFETLFRWVNRDRIEGFSYEAPLKDNSKAIDCIIGNMAIQLKNTKSVNKDKELAYIKAECERRNRPELKPKLVVCTDDIYSRLLSQCDFNKPSIILKPYQKDFIDKHLNGICSHHVSIVNCFCRFGKSYLMRYIADMFKWDVSVITTKPTETSGDYQFEDVVSIQKLKLHHSEIKLKDILFIDEPQESFMTDLTEMTLNLKDFKHVVFFTGTSAVLEQYIGEDYYLAHYNFGDYISHPVEGFPKIHFHLGESSEPKHGIRLIFNRNLSREDGREEAKRKGWKFQSAADETDIRISTEGTYLLISQFTTGATIPNCFIIEDRNESFTEQDIQLIFRCFNQDTDLDIERHVYFKDPIVYKAVLVYLYRQTGKSFINGSILKDFFSGIVDPADIDSCGFDYMRIHLDGATAKSLRKAIKKAYEKAKERYGKAIKNILKSKRHVNHHEYRALQELKRWTETGEPDPKMTILCMRLMTGLLLSAYQEKVDMSHINEFNQDIDVMYLWTHTKDKSRVKYQFETFRFSEDDFPEKGELTEPICEGIFEVMKECVKEKFLLNALEMIQTPLSKQKYEEMCELYPTTEIEKTENAEILTPWEVAEEMVNACEEYGVLKSGYKVLEPCCGKGVFLTLLLLRGYDVDYSDVSPANVQFCDILTGREGSVQDALKRKDYDKYDLVITNPPYSQEREGITTGKCSIYHLFGERALQAKASCFLVKSAFCTACGNTQQRMEKFRHNLIQHLQYKRFYKQDVFQGVQIQGGVMFYIYNNEYKNPAPTEFITEEGEYIKTYDDNILNYFDFQPRSNIETNDTRIIESPCEGYIPCYMSKDRIKYFPRNQVPYDINAWYLIFPEAASFKNESWKVFKRFEIVKPGECFTRSFIGFQVKDEDEAKRLEAHLEKYEPEIAKLKRTQDITKNYFRVVPRMESAEASSVDME